MTELPMRWGLTYGAYEKYSYLFDMDFPIHIDCTSPLMVATHIRDVIRFADHMGLPGKDWYKNVVVTAKRNYVLIVPKAGKMPKAEIVHSVFEVIEMVESGKVPDRYECKIPIGAEELEPILLDHGYKISNLYSNLFLIEKIKEA